MKSVRGLVEAKCPHCDAPAFEAEIWSLIRADSEPELREAVRYGELNLLECPACSNFFYYEAPVVYFDPPAELLVFLLPASYEAQAQKWRAKMLEDYAQMKDALSRELSIDYEPLVLFGADNLQKLLDEALALEDEDSVIAALAAEQGFGTKTMRPSLARAGGYPCAVPYEGAACGAAEFRSAAQKLLSAGLASPRLKRLLSDVTADPRKFPDLK